MCLRRFLSATLLAWFILLLTSACAFLAQRATPVMSPGGPEILDARAASVLPNGMQVLLVEAPTPLVATLVLVKTGSSDETEANAGVSHLLEHILFDGTARRTKEELFREVYGMGGYLNGFTSEEYTGFILMAHPDYLDKMLDIQSDILFHSLFDAGKLEITKGVVIEEIRQALTNPSAREADLHKARLYRDTSYAHPVLGNEQVIRRLPRDEILTYYRAHYVPNNMVLVLVGPVGKQEALAKISQAFGAEAPQMLASSPGALPTPPDRAEVYVEETPATRKKLLLSLIVPAMERGRYPAWEVLAGLLDDRLRQARDRPGAPRILSIGAGFSLGRHNAVLEVSAIFPRETNEDEVRRLVEREMALLAGEPIRPEEVRRIRKSLQGEEARLAERIHYYATEKAARILALGVAGVRSYVDRIGRIQPDEVSAVGHRLAEPPYVASVFLPPEAPAETESSVKPGPPQRTVLPNGLTVIAQEIPRSPVFAAHVLIRGRGTLEAEGQDGLVEALLRLLGRGTERRSTEDLTRTVQDMGGHLETAGDPTSPFGDSYTSREYGYIRLEALAEYSRQGLNLLAEILMEPRLSSDEVEKVRGELRNFVEADQQQPRRVGEELLFRMLFPEQPLAKSIYGTPSWIANIRRDQLLALKHRYLGASHLIVSIVSSLPTQAAFAAAAEALGRIPRSDPAVELPPLPVTRGVREVRQHLGKPQAQLFLGKALPPVSPRERFALEIAGSILSARLFGTLREKEGLTYSVDAGVSFPQGSPLLLIGMGTAPQSVDQAKAGILRELKAAGETPTTKDEVQRRANGLAGRLAMRMLSSVNRAYYLDVAEFRGLGLNYVETHRDTLLSVSPEEVTAVLRKYFGQEDYVLAIVD